MTRQLRSWIILVLITVAIASAMRFVHMPAWLMLGPMASAVIVALWRPGLKLPGWTPLAAQALLGCLIAHLISPGLLAGLSSDWPILLGINLLSILAIMGLGLAAALLRWFPGTAALWGMSPGGASAMVLLSESYGSDKRLVALMQYLRVLAAALTVIAIGTLLGVPHPPSASTLPGGAGTRWLAPVDLVGLGAVLLLAGAGMLSARLLKQSSLGIFIPVFGGIAFQAATGRALDIPPIAAAAAFCVIGWHVGLSFTRASLLYNARLMPRIAVATVLVLATCALLAVPFALLMDTSYLTAFMALNPGGTDAVIVMAASVDVDLPLIMTMQVLRIIIVTVLAPALATFAARRFLDAAPAVPDRDDVAEHLARDSDLIG